MSQPLHHYYVYYRVSRSAEARAAEGVRGLITRIEHSSGVPGRLLRRRESPDTWMESYGPVADPAAFEEVLAQAENEAGCSAWLAEGETRHTECFLDWSS